MAPVFVTGDSIVYSASDLAAAARCEFALLRDFDAKLGRGPATAIEDELLTRTATLGDEHERRELARLRERFGDAVAVIGRPAYTPAGLAAATDATLRAVADHAPRCIRPRCSTAASSDSPTSWSAPASSIGSSTPSWPAPKR